MKRQFLFGGIVFVVLAIAALWYGSVFLEKKVSRVIVRGHTFSVELATTEDERLIGLGGRDALCPDCGMLFVFGHPDRYGFWMKDMRFPLDILWIKDDKIVFIASKISPDFSQSIQPPVSADKVLELNAGTADKYDIAEGSVVEIR